VTETPPERLGPYRIEGRLGRGGMGEVFAAYDQRLDRRVAIKLVRPEGCAGSGARERLRREARAAAALSHPAIVCVHDILAGGDDESDAIVMELVEGETLAQRLQTGPCPIPFALRLGAEVAGGLAAAHARSIVHRDLKTENVMIDRDGRAKILDFGIAKRPPSYGDPALTVDGVVLGTSRVMSPEQARGLDVDHRSDLFALGVLLYEAVTGQSPFLAATPLDTMTRICFWRQPPAMQLRPQLPATVSALIDRLLEKDPMRRPQSTEQVAALLAEAAARAVPGSERPPGSAHPGEAPDAATLADLELPALPETWQVPMPLAPPGVDATRDIPETAAPAVTAAPGSRPEPASRPWWARQRRARVLIAVLAGVVALAAGTWLALSARRAPRLFVAVPAPTIGAGGGLDGVDLQAAAVRAALLRGLLSLAGVSPLAAEQVDPVGGSPVAVARATAADEVVTARLDCNSATCRIVLNRILGRNGALLWTQGFEAPMGQPYLLAETVTSTLRHGYSERARGNDASSLGVSAAGYAEYLRLDDEVLRRRQGLPLDALISRVRLLRQRSPRFLEAPILEASLLRQRFGASRNRADLDAAAAALREARTLAPGDPRPLQGLFEVALRAEQLPGAAAALRDLERLLPSDPEVEVARGRLLERQGDRLGALAQLRAAARERPSWRILYRLADMEYRLGEPQAARRHLEQLLARFPGSYHAQSMLAQIELLAGSPERAAALYTRLVEHGPQVGEVANLGLAHLLLGSYGLAERRFRQALELEPGSPLVALDLADAVLLQGRREEAGTRYRTLLRQAARDAAAAGWQLTSIRAQAHAHLGERTQAVVEVQRVLELAPGNPQAEYEASLVYALVGDDASALVNGERALARGVGARWFFLPWFDRLRTLPELRERLAAGAAEAPREVASPAAAPR
jgi:tetratricopeptide (TPR) repeat protein